MAVEIDVIGRQLTLDEAAEMYAKWIHICDWRPRPSLYWFWAYSESGTDVEEHWPVFRERVRSKYSDEEVATAERKAFDTPHTADRG